MALPQVMQKRRAALKEAHSELVEVEQPTKVMIPIDAPAGPANEGGDLSVDTPAPLVVETPAVVNEVEELRQQYKSLQGVIAGLEPKYRSEKETVARLEQELQALREAMPKPAPVLDPSEELTEEELQVYGGSKDVIAKIAKKIAKGELSSALKDMRKEIEELRAANTRVQIDLTQTSEQQFLAHVKSVVKNFDGITGSKEWSEYLAKKVPYSRKTIYDSLSEAHEARDLDTIKEIFEGFKPNRAALAAMASPTLNGGSAPIDTSGNKKPILKLSDRKKISEDFRKGRLSREERDKWDKLYKEAEAEDRIDYQH